MGRISSIFSDRAAGRHVGGDWLVASNNSRLMVFSDKPAEKLKGKEGINVKM